MKKTVVGGRVALSTSLAFWRKQCGCNRFKILMYIHGIGIISSVGRGIEAHRQALTDASLPAVVDGFHRVSEKDLKDPILVKEARRADRFDRMAILAGLDALADAGIYSDASLSTVGLILATGFGPHTTTFRFLDDLLNFKEKMFRQRSFLILFTTLPRLICHFWRVYMDRH